MGKLAALANKMDANGMRDHADVIDIAIFAAQNGNPEISIDILESMAGIPNKSAGIFDVFRDQQKLVGRLSGGERNRVHLAKLLQSGGNLILLDEPSNDLDVDTLRSLEEAILKFAGCALVISHDRWFLDRVATHILAFEGDSQVVWFEGKYADYEQDRRKRLGAEADRPKRIKYKPISR